MGRCGIKGLKTMVMQGCIISQPGARLYSGGICVGGVPGGSHSVTIRGRGGQLQE